MEVEAGGHFTATGIQSVEKEKHAVERDDIILSSAQNEAMTGTNTMNEDNKLDQEQGRPAIPLSKIRSVALVATVAGAAFLNSFGIQSIVIALPTVGADLRIPDSRQQWIVSAYSLTFGCFLLLWGRLADVYGKKLVFVLGSIWFSLVALAIPFVQDEILLDLLRGFQGLGAAATVPTGIGILGTTFTVPGKARNYAFSCFGAGAPVGSVFGNILGGFIAEYLSWKWIFWIHSIFAALITISAIFAIPAGLHDAAVGFKGAVDWIGGTLITCGLLALLFALAEGNVVGWATPWVPVLIVASIMLVAIFAFWQWHLEKRCRQPLMKISIFRKPEFSAAMIIMTLLQASFNNFLIFGTYFYQDYLGLNTIQTTLRFIPTGVVGLITALGTGLLLSHIRGFYLLTFSCLCVSTASLLFAVPIPPHLSYFATDFLAMCLSVFGIDTLYVSLTLFTSQALPQQDQALGGALINAVAQIGRAMGLAIGTAVQTAVMAGERGVAVQDLVSASGGAGFENAALLKGLRATEWLGVGMGIAALGLVLAAFRGMGKVGQ